MRHHPDSFKGLSFHDAVPDFITGTDTPRVHLERCLAQIAARNPAVQAFAVVHEALARAAADASSARWKAGQPLSAIDGMPMAFDRASESGTALRALREAGAVIVGETVAAGSAAAVAARMCAAALDTQARGGVIRSASCCANSAFEPTQDILAPCGHPAGGVKTTGVHAGSIGDLWPVATAIARRVGGDPGRTGSPGPEITPEAMRPHCLIVIESAVWAAAGEATRTAFQALLDQIACAGVRLLRRRDRPAIEAIERAIVNADDIQPADLRAQLQRSALAQRGHAALAPLADAIVMLSAPGPIPGWTGCPPGALLLGPRVSLPLMSVNGLPVGAQLIGQSGEDARVVALARWVTQEAGTVAV